MLAEQRRDMILEILDSRGSVSVSELHRRLKVSRETIRRDITRLASEDRLRKTHGGALSRDSEEPALSERRMMNVEGKRAIGEAAAEMVPDGASLILDSGTTVQCLAEALMGHRRLTIYTNDLQIAGRLAGRNGNRVLVLGGELAGSEGAAFGPDAAVMLERYFTDFAFVGASAVAEHPLLTDYTRDAAELHALMFTHARTAVLLADHTKFNRIAPVRVDNVDRIATMITDTEPAPALVEALGRIGAELRVVSGGPEALVG